MTLLLGAVGSSVVCDCGISCSYSLLPTRCRLAFFNEVFIFETLIAYGVQMTTAFCDCQYINLKEKVKVIYN